MATQKLSDGQQEQIVRLVSAFNSLSGDEQNAFLVQAGLSRLEGNANSVLSDGSAHAVNRLIVSPAAAAGSSPERKNRIRADEALRLVRDNNAIVEHRKGDRLVVTTSLPRSREDIREWFEVLAESTDADATLSKETFRSMYLNSLEDFGVPNLEKTIDRRLAALNPNEDRPTFDQFHSLVAPLISQ